MSAVRVVMLSGLIAGTLDIADALVFYGLRGVSATRLLQGIAGGALGPAAFRGGMSTALLGLIFHFLIAFTAATVFYLLSRRVGLFRTHAVVSGVLFGLLVYAFMNMVVLPLSKAGAPRFSGVPFVNGVLAVVLLVGLPISLICGRYGERA